VEALYSCKYNYVIGESMGKVNLCLRVDESVAKKLRDESMRKYNNMRSISRLIEDMANNIEEL